MPIHDDTDAIDRAVTAVSGALTLLGIVVPGLVEALDGPPFGAAPVTNDAGEVVATPLVDLALRTGLVLAGLVLLGLWSVYTVGTPYEGSTPDPETGTSVR